VSGGIGGSQHLLSRGSRDGRCHGVHTSGHDEKAGPGVAGAGFAALDLCAGALGGVPARPANRWVFQLLEAGYRDMELWIVLGLAVAAAGIGVVARFRRAARRRSQAETKNIYPLW
jgi:hypothetical protein